MFALLYKALQLLNLDTAWTVAYGPRILQGIVTVVTDVFLYKLARTYFDGAAAKYALLCQLASWFIFFALSRTFSNSIETCCTTIALRYWPWHFLTGESKRRDDLVESSSMTTKQQTRKAFAFAALGCIFRPTNAVLWVFLTATLVVQTKSKLALLLHTIVPVGVLAISLMLVVDRIGYGEWTCVPWNFVKFNVLEGKDKLYGVHPWYWYFVAGYPEITATHLPLILFGGFLTQKRELAAVIVWGLCVFSLGAHKEPRFLLPLLPASFVYAGKALLYLEKRTFFKPLLGLLILLNGIAAVYFARFHQRAPLEVMDYLVATVHPTDSVDFLVPCHATPFYSHLHQNISLWFPSCTPSEREAGSPSDALRQDPLAFATARYKSHPLPTYIVVYSSGASALHNSLAIWKFALQKQFDHSTLSLDADSPVADTHMLVYSNQMISP
ncbi:hypothetical protein, variant [Aphanomyces astaci]|nr:hypothetical protein, variant [Aphanomyces astaci]ETV77912.1 hypothetical protein, variant [Aphanomyces astaci]|eukprot:XP_009832249.1 hypothetical protein, variant [Aphanomyces astaci]